MAKPTPKSRNQASLPVGRQAPHLISNNYPEVVDPVWLLKALGIAVFAALICGYVTICLLFYQGQWQLVLHPSKATPAPPTIAGDVYETIHFGVDESGAPQLTGWWLSAGSGSKYAAYTLLYLPSGDTSLADAAGDIAAIHNLGINIFAFDYRGYGQSAPTRPNQVRMTEDAASAWKYLTVSRAIPAAQVVPFGVGVGGALAVQLATKHSELQAVVIESPRPDLLQVVLADPRTKMLPVRALFHDRFDIASPLATLKTPKLFLLTDEASHARALSNPAAVRDTVNSASEPRMISILKQGNKNGPAWQEQVRRFLDQYLR